jgi:hypothetical protein
MIKTILSLVLIHASIFFHSSHGEKQAELIEGIVLKFENNQPLEKALVYTILGEEEVLTNQDGKFILKTYQPLPLILHIHHSDTEDAALKVESSSKKLTILLKRKQSL